MAKKYIDADLLRKEIESRMGDCDANSKNPNQLLWAELAALLPFLDSLQQEQSCDTCTNDKGCVTCKDGELWEGKSEVDLEKEIDKTVNECTDGYNFDWDRFARHFYILGLKNNIPVTQITLDELAKEGEPVSKDLEEAAEEYSRGLDYYHYTGDDPAIAFIAGAEWQAERLLKGSPMPEDTVIFQKGIAEGKRLMMEDAMEGEVCKGDGDVWIELSPNAMPHFKDMQPVKVIVIKED